MKRALVISGGGSKGAFAVGILQRLAMLFPTLHFDIIVGASTGALMAPLATLEELSLLEQLYLSRTTETVITKHRLGDRLNEKSIYTVEPLWQLIQNTVTDARYAAIKASGKGVYIITTCLQTEGIAVYTTNPQPKPSSSYTLKPTLNAEHFRLAVLGSACQPVFMTPVKIDAAFAAGKEKNFQYVDGGVREYAGIQMAIDQGATEVFCILLSPEKAEEQPAELTSLFPILERTISMLSEDVQKNDVVIPKAYAAALRYIQAVKRKMANDGISPAKINQYFTIDGPGNPYEATGVKLFLLRPETPLGGGPGGLVFNSAEMQGMIEKGRGAAQAFAGKLNPGDVTWLA